MVKTEYVTVHIGHTVLTLQFDHYTNNELLQNGKYRSGTGCLIWNAVEAIGGGFAILKPGEAYNESIGRHYSALRAMQDANFDEQDYEDAFEWYYDYYGHAEYEIWWRWTKFLV